MLEHRTETQSIKGTGFSGYHLKLIALITMFIDHVGATVLWRLYVASFHITASMQLSDSIGDMIVVWIAGNQELVEVVYESLRLIGRVAFPIYCFLLVEGFLYTRSVTKYAGRLFLFALISEFPFDMALSGAWDNNYCNVFFTLFVGLILIWCISYVEKFYEFWMEKHWDEFIGRLLCVSAGLILTVTLGWGAEMISTDYGMTGVLSILVIYLFRNKREIGYSLAVILLTILSSDTEIVAFLGLIPLMKYDGTRGKNIKYVFYAFYPVHLLILGLICMGLGV